MKSIVYATGLLCLLSTVSVYADDPEENRCALLKLDITNASNANAKLMGNPEYARIHGYIERRGQVVVPNGHTTVWVLHEHPFTGPTGTIVYSWQGSNGAETCTIHYDQSFCGPFRGGSNNTHVEGNCFAVNDPGKPSKPWSLPGESQITLGERY